MTHANRAWGNPDPVRPLLPLESQQARGRGRDAHRKSRSRSQSREKEPKMDEPSEHPARFAPPHADSGESGQSWSEDEEASFEAADAEARPPKALRHPTLPTAEERRVHDACHLPPRSWCPHCVRGAFKEKPHRATDADIKRGVHSFHLDYWFLGESSPDSKENPRAVSEDAYIRASL